MSGAAYNKGRSKQDYATPAEFLMAVQDRFGRIYWDLAAHAENRVTDADRYYGPGSKHGEDSLAQDWSLLRLGVLWLNPPFAHIAPWAAKCAKHRHDRTFTCMLVPASVGTNWYAEHVHGKALELYLRPRIKFVGEPIGYPKDLALFVFGFGLSGAQPWDWRAALARSIAAKRQPERMHYAPCLEDTDLTLRSLLSASLSSDEAPIENTSGSEST